MTKKDYELIANAIRQVKVNCLTEEPSETRTGKLKVINHLVEILAHYLKAENPRFNKFKFYQAIYPPEDDHLLG